MTNKNKKQTAKQKRILVASILLAGMIVAGGTFAWFTSQDEVTNKLTASNNYGVSITEDFTPPSNWTPGQVVNKDVSVVNTGNVDAFVKVSLSNTLDLTTLTKDGIAISNNTDFSDAVKLDDVEVASLQAGGRLVWEAGAKPKTETVGTGYKPSATGLYVFERDLDIATDTRTYEYVGYYYDGTNYYALNTIKGDKTEGFSAYLKTTSSKSTGLLMTFNYANVDDTEKPHIVAKYNAGTDDTKDDIIVNINLVSNWNTYWTFDKTENVFYYNDTVKAGDASKRLIESLELDDSVSNEAYYSFDYNLKITADSVQVVTGENGKQTADAVNWTLIPSLNYDTDDKTISSVTWGTEQQDTTTSTTSTPTTTQLLALRII